MKPSFLSMTIALVVLAPAAAAQTVEGPQTDQGRPLFRVLSELVLVDVVAVDGRGQPVTDLRPEEVEIFEEGHRVEAVHFELVSRLKAPPEGPRDDRERSTPDRPVPFVFLLDLNSMDTPALVHSKEAIRRFLSTGWTPQDRAMMAVVDRELTIVHPFSGDTESLLRSLQTVERANGILSYRGLLERFSTLYRSLTCVDCDPLQQALLEAREFLRDLKRRFRTAADALSGLSDHLAGLPGRKHLIHFSVGYPIKGNAVVLDMVKEFADLHIPSKRRLLGSDVSIDPILSAKLGGALSSYTDEWNRALDQANAGQLTVYTVDARGLVARNLAESSEAGTIPSYALARYSFEDISAPQEFLKATARSTGGLSYLNQNDLEEGAGWAYRDAQAFYLLGYRPPEGRKDRFRRIKVEVKRPGVQVRHRNGYFRRPQQPPDQRDLDNAFKFPGLFDDFPVDWTVETNGDRLSVEARIPSPELRFQSLEGSNHCRIELYGALIDEAGKWVGSGYAFARHFPLKRDTEGLRRLRELKTVSAVAETRGEGEYELRVVVRQHPSGYLATHRQKVVLTPLGR